MAQVPKYTAAVQLGDSAHRFGSASVFVNAADAKAYVAAADATARLATDVGVLLAATLAMTDANGTSGWKRFAVGSDFINDAFAFPALVPAKYLSNHYKVTYNTTNAGFPTVESIYIPIHAAGVAMESNGVNVDLTDTIPAAYIAALVATGISSYNTAILSVIEITVNDV